MNPFWGAAKRSTRADTFFAAKRPRGAEPLQGPAGKKGGSEGFVGEAIPIGLNAKEREIGAVNTGKDEPLLQS